MSIRTRYGALQCLYWMMNCVSFGYSTYFLLEAGFNAGKIGLILAAGGTAAAFIQNLLGKGVDQGHFSWKICLLVLDAIYFASCIAALLLDSKAILAAVFMLFLCAVNCFVPIASGASFYYERRGIDANFGMARAGGSLGYAIISAVIGRVTVKAGYLSVPVIGIIVAVLLAAVILMMPCEKEVLEGGDTKEKGRSIMDIVKKYPGFILVVLGCTFALSFHLLINNYLITVIENVGGDASSMGFANSVAALVEMPIMFIFSWILKKVSVQKVLMFASICYVVRSFMYFIASNVFMIYIAQLFQIGTFALLIPASVYFTDKVMEKEDQMKGQALMGCSFTLGYVIGCMSGGYIIDFLGLKMLFVAGIIFAVIGLVFMITGLERCRKNVIAS